MRRTRGASGGSFMLFFEVTGQFVDASGKQCHLNFRGAGIALSALELRDDFGF